MGTVRRTRPLFEFEWDHAKARTNRAKHGVTFDEATEIFRDPFALTLADDEHGVNERRWVTVGRDSQKRYLLVIHTYNQIDEAVARVRIISARRPTRVEIRAYEEWQ